MAAMLIAPYYRNFELPWSPTEDVERRFRLSLRNALIGFAVLGLIVPFLPLPDRKLTPPALPDRVVQLVIEKRTPPPPPPPPKEEEKPKPVEAEQPKPIVEPKPEPKPIVEPPKEDARKKAQQAMMAFDDLAALRDSAVLDKAQQSTNLTSAVTEQTRSERAMLTSRVGTGSGGINTASMSRGYGGSTGTLKDQGTTQVSSSIGTGSGQAEARRSGSSGKAARSREEVELTFDRNKGAIYSLYSRALRETPDLRGKVVLEITIAPSGEVTDCKLISSELNNPDLERKLIARVKSFRFEPREVESLTLTKPIDFFPAG
jgi:protein TonB